MGNVVRKYDPDTGDEVLVVNGAIDVASGGAINVKSGGAVSIESGGAITYGSAVVEPFTVVKLSYDFATDGGEVGDIDLGGALPAGAVILDGLLVVTEAVTGGENATIALKAKTANDILAAAVLGTNGTEGAHDIVASGAANKAIVLAEETDITLTVGVAALTAGAFDLYLRMLL